jgi:anti-anti-sigma factor
MSCRGGDLVQSDTFRIQSDTTSVELIGILDRVAVPDARRLLIDIAQKSGTRYFDVDLAQVSSLDTAGIALLVELLNNLSRRGKELRLTNPNEPVKQMIHLARLDRILDTGLPEDEK